MNDTALQVSQVIDGVAKALAEWTVTRQSELDAELPRRYGHDWRHLWVGDVQVRMGHLAQAVAVRRPALFSESVAWTGGSFAARDVRIDDLRISLRAMREVLAAELPEPVAVVATEYVDEALARLDGGLPDAAPEDAATNGDGDRPHGRLVLELLAAILERRGDDAHALVIDAARGGVPVRDLYLHVLGPAQVELGRMWYMDESTIADEHYATAIVQAVMARLRDHFPDVTPNGRRAVAAAVSGEGHDVGLRMVADFLAMDGWDVAYFGTDLPSAEVIRALRDREAHLLATSTSTPLRMRALGELVRAVRGAEGCEGVKVMVGGVPFLTVPDLWEELGADGCARSAADAVTLARSLVAPPDSE